MNNFPEYKYDLSLEHDGSNRFMVWIMACFVFVATLAMFSAMAADKMVTDWQSYAVNQATLEIPYGPDNENIGLTLAERLAPLNVIDSVEIIPPEETTALVQSAIGTSADDETVDLSNLPLPLLLTVSFNEDMSDQDFKVLSGLIREVEPEVRIHRHERWASDILDYGKVLRGGALLLLILMAADRPDPDLDIDFARERPSRRDCHPEHSWGRR